jgi:hypothetical protein
MLTFLATIPGFARVDDIVATGFRVNTGVRVEKQIIELFLREIPPHKGWLGFIFKAVMFFLIGIFSFPFPIHSHRFVFLTRRTNLWFGEAHGHDVLPFTAVDDKRLITLNTFDLFFFHLNLIYPK